MIFCHQTSTYNYYQLLYQLIARNRLKCRCFTGSLSINEVDSKIVSHGIAVIDGFFHSFIGKIELVPHEIHTGKDSNIIRPTASLVVIIVRSDELDSLIPWNQGILCDLFFANDWSIPCH